MPRPDRFRPDRGRPNAPDPPIPAAAGPPEPIDNRLGSWPDRFRPNRGRPNGVAALVSEPGMPGSGGPAPSAYFGASHFGRAYYGPRYWGLGVAPMASGVVMRRSLLPARVGSRSK